MQKNKSDNNFDYLEDFQNIEKEKNRNKRLLKKKYKNKNRRYDDKNYN